jgi:hypothetical protein
MSVNGHPGKRHRGADSRRRYQTFILLLAAMSGTTAGASRLAPEQIAAVEFEGRWPRVLLVNGLSGKREVGLASSKEEAAVTPTNQCSNFHCACRSHKRPKAKQ